MLDPDYCTCDILSQLQRPLALSHVPASLGPIRAHVAHHDGHDGRWLEARGCRNLKRFAACKRWLMKRGRGGKWRIILGSYRAYAHIRSKTCDSWSLVQRWESRRISYRWRRISGTRHAPGNKCTPPVDNVDSAKNNSQLIQQFHSGEGISIW